MTMQNTIHGALFGVYPYIALAVFLIGSLVRFDVDQYGWRSKSRGKGKSFSLMRVRKRFHFAS